MPDFSEDWESRDEILDALERSIIWMHREHARQFFPQAGIEHGRALASLERFRDLLRESFGPREFQAASEEEFQVYVSAGWDGRGGGGSSRSSGPGCRGRGRGGRADDGSSGGRGGGGSGWRRWRGDDRGGRGGRRRGDPAGERRRCS